MSLTLKEYQERNIKFSKVAFPQCMDWILTDWTNAIAGEAGEACNIAKKVRRGDFTLDEAKFKLLKEIADVMCYCSIFCSILEVDIEHVVNDKFQEVLARDEAKRLAIPIHEPDLSCNT